MTVNMNLEHPLLFNGTLVSSDNVSSFNRARYNRSAWITLRNVFADKDYIVLGIEEPSNINVDAGITVNAIDEHNCNHSVYIQYNEHTEKLRQIFNIKDLLIQFASEDLLNLAKMVL